MFTGGTEVEHWLKMGQESRSKYGWVLIKSLSMKLVWDDFVLE